MPTESMEVDASASTTATNVAKTNKKLPPTHTATEMKEYESLLSSPIVADKKLSYTEQSKIEKAIYALNEQYSFDKNASKLDALVKTSRPFFQHLSKAKAGKLGMFVFMLCCVCVLFQAIYVLNVQYSKTDAFYTENLSQRLKLGSLVCLYLCCVVFVFYSKQYMY